MRIYPRRFKALTIDGINVFPYYSSNGLSFSQMAVIFDGDPIEEMSFGLDDMVVKSGEKYRYIVLIFNERIGESALAQKVEQAEQLIENSL